MDLRYHINPFAVPDNSDTHLQCDANGNLKVTVAAAPATAWQYAAAAGGIVNTSTAVTIATAGGAGIRNYLTSLNIISDVLTVASEIVVRDGAAGPVLWRGKLPTTGGPLNPIFATAIKGTANTLMEIATITPTVTGAVYCNAQGFQAV